MSAETTDAAARLRAGAAAMRSIVGPEAIWIPAIAEGLENDAIRLDRGEPVDDLEDALALADSVAEVSR